MLGNKCNNMKIAGMSAEDFVVHYGGAPYDGDLNAAENSEKLENWVETHGNWECMLALAIENWARACVEQGEIHTSSL